MDVLSGMFMCAFVINFISAIVTNGDTLHLLLAGICFGLGWAAGLICLTKKLTGEVQKIISAIKGR